MFVLGCIAVGLFCVSFWGSMAALAVQNWFLLKVGFLMLGGIILLTLVIGFVYLAVDLIVHRQQLQAELEMSRDIEEKGWLDAEVGTWSDVFCTSALVCLVVVMYGVLIPIMALIIPCSLLFDKIRSAS